MASGQRWSREELLVAFRLYCHTPFGKLHQRNPAIIDLARLLSRTPSALAMKACNFASFDPVHRERNVKGLANVSAGDRAVWEEFILQPDQIAIEAEMALAQFAMDQRDEVVEPFHVPEGPSEVVRTIQQRRLQSFFRKAVLASYEYRCALTGLTVQPLLNASHIVPWSVKESRRADPSNGILLNALHDRAFDRGLITFDESNQVVVSTRLRTKAACTFQAITLLDFEGAPLARPHRFAPDPEAMAYHRTHVFLTD
ncbi:HNH endonuclease [bacterium]|nr:HNH endonuclease [bacterium]